MTRIVGFGRIAVEPSTHILAALGVHGSGDLIVALGPRKHKDTFPVESQYPDLIGYTEPASDSYVPSTELFDLK